MEEKKFQTKIRKIRPNGTGKRVVEVLTSQVVISETLYLAVPGGNTEGDDNQPVSGPRGASRISSPACLNQTVVKLWQPPNAFPVQIYKI